MATKKATSKAKATKKDPKSAAKKSASSAKTAKKAASPAKAAKKASVAKKVSAAKKTAAKKAAPKKAVKSATKAPKKAAPQKSAPKAATKTAKKSAAKAPTKATAKKSTAKKSTAAYTISPSPTAAPKAAATQKQDAAPAKPKAPAAPIISDKKAAHGFKIGEHIVYPAHGVGLIREISLNEIAGMTLELFVIDFEKEKMILRVPLDKAKSIGMRKLADKVMLEASLKTLRGRARIKRTMWSRRAQEYEAKINSGDLVAIAEVVRDLFRNENQPEQSYSERQLYEAALERMAREYGTIQKITDDEAIIELEKILAKTTGGAPKATGASA